MDGEVEGETRADRLNAGLKKVRGVLEGCGWMCVLTAYLIVWWCAECCGCNESDKEASGNEETGAVVCPRQAIDEYVFDKDECWIGQKRDEQKSTQLPRGRRKTWTKEEEKTSAFSTRDEQPLGCATFSQACIERKPGL